MNPKVSHKPSQPHSNDAKLTVPSNNVGLPVSDGLYY